MHGMRIDGNVIFVARWTVVLAFNPTGGTVSPPGIYARTGLPIGGPLPVPSTRPNRVGYDFVGWSTAVTGGTPVTENTIMPNGNMTVFAVWVPWRWYSDEDRVGFRLGNIDVYHRTIGPENVSASFNLTAQVNIARTAWGGALGITIGTATYANAQIQAFGGIRDDIDDFRGVVSIDAGFAERPTYTFVTTVIIGGRVRRVYRYIGRSRIFTVNDWWCANTDKMITNHELGHALGWYGHSSDSRDVMFHQAHASYELRANEIRHLRRIYDHFRP